MTDQISHIELTLSTEKSTEKAIFFRRIFFLNSRDQFSQQKSLLNMPGNSQKMVWIILMRVRDCVNNQGVCII